MGKMNRVEKFQLVDEEGNVHDAVKITPTRRIRGSNELITKLPSFKLATGERLNPDGDGFKALHSEMKFKHL